MWNEIERDEENDEYELDITECTLKLQGLASGELAKLTRGQGELIALELQGHRGLRLGDAPLTDQLSDLHISTLMRLRKHLR